MSLNLFPKHDDRIPIGKCEECGENVYRAEERNFEDDYPYKIENLYFHEHCVMSYARFNWAIND